MSNIVYALGNAEVIIPAGESIAVSTVGDASVRQVLGFPNFPDREDVLGTVTDTETVFGPFASGATIIVENIDQGDVLYSVGLSPVVIENIASQSQGAPNAQTTAVTLTIANLLAGIVTGTHAAGADVDYTLPTGTLSDEGLEMAIGESFDWSLINLSAAAADTITVTAGTGHTIVGNPIIQAAHVTTGGITGSAGMWRTRKTAANTFISYRIS